MNRDPPNETVSRLTDRVERGKDLNEGKITGHPITKEKLWKEW